MFSAIHFSPLSYSKCIFLIATFLILWLLKSMAFVRKTFALYLTVSLENKDFNATQTWVGMFLMRHMFIVLISTSCWLYMRKTRRRKKIENLEF